MELREHQDKKCSLRKQYDLFLAEDQKRKERNAQILQKLDNITQKANHLQYRADRVKSLKWRDQSPPRLLPDQTLRISPLPYGLAAPYTPPRIPPYYYEPQKQDLLKPDHSIPNIPPQVPMFYPMQYPNFIYPQPPQYVNNLTIDDIVKEINKKYILIPRRTTENLNKEDAHELHPDKRRNEESDVSWRDKYDILDKLHNNEDVATNGKSEANNDNKSPTHEPAGSSKVNLNEIKITLNDFEDWQNRLHGKDRKNDIEHVNLSKENDKSLREVYFADDKSNFKIQPNTDTQPRFDNSVKPKSHNKDIEIPTDEINVVEDCVNNTPFATTDVTVNGAEPLYDTIKPSALPELASHDNIVNANTNLSHNGKVLIPKNELEVRAKANMGKQTNQVEYVQPNETTIQEEKYNNIPTQDRQPGKVLIPKNELEVRAKANIGKQTNQVEYVQPNETTIQAEKCNNIPTQDPQPEEYYQETDNQNPDYVQDPISNYNVENDYIQNESSEHYTEQNQEQYDYTNQQEMYQEEHPTTQTNIEQEHLTSAQEYYDQNSYETPQNETMNSDMAYENVVEPSQEYTPNVYTEDPNSQYAVQDSNESFAVDEYQNETVTEQLYPQGTYDNQHLTQDGEYTQNPNEVVDNSNINEQNIPYDYNQSEQPQHEYDQTNYQQYESNNQQVYEGQYYQEQAYPVTEADIGSVAEAEQEYMPVEQEYTQAEQDTKPLTFLESDTDPGMSVQEQNKQDSEFAFSAGKPEVGRSENN